MTLEDDHTPERQTPNGLSTTLRQKIMRRVRSYFCPTPLYDSLAEKFDKLVETLGWPADPSSARPGNAATPLIPASHTEECAPVGAALDVVDDKHPDIWPPDLDEEEVDGDDYNEDWDEGDFDEEAQYPEGLILVVTGETGAGKSRAIERLIKMNGHRLGDSLVSVSAPSPCTLMQLGRTLLPALGYPIQRDRKEHIIWEEVRRRLDDQGKRVLHIDEMQHLPQSANVEQRTRILNTVKSLIQRRADPMLLILSGTPELADFLRTDGQVRRRCRFIEFRRLAIPTDILALSCTLEDLTRVARLRIDVNVADDVAARLIHASNYAAGIAIELAREAIEEALRGRDTEVTWLHFEQAYADRTACSKARNPFVVNNWLELDPTQILDRVERPVEKPKPKKRRTKGRSNRRHQ